MENVKARQVRLWIGIIFVLLLTGSAVLSTVAVIVGLKGESAWVPLQDASPAVRLLLFVIGLGLSWVVGRFLYQMLVSGEIEVGDSVSIACMLALYGILIAATIAFLAVLYWFLLPFLFLILVVISVLAIWRLLGGLYSFGALAAAAIASAVTLYLVG
jgi:hypothetical protein